jgi:hypothetical protein
MILETILISLWVTSKYKKKYKDNISMANYHISVAWIQQIGTNGSYGVCKLPMIGLLMDTRVRMCERKIVTTLHHLFYLLVLFVLTPFEVSPSHLYIFYVCIAQFVLRVTCATNRQHFAEIK